MTNLSNLLPPENILLDIDINTKRGLFERMGRFFAESSNLSAAVITENLLTRETLGSTALGQGIAIPHGRIEGLHEPHAAFVRLATPLSDFDAPDNLPVNLLFFLLVPEQATERHLEILSQIAQLLSNKGTREIMQTGTVLEIKQALPLQ